MNDANDKAPKGANITLIVEKDLHELLINLAKEKGIDVCAQIKFILWEHFDS